MVVIDGLGKIQQFLKHAVDGGGGVKIAPAHHMADPLAGIVDHDSDMIARADILAHQHDIAPQTRIGRFDSSPVNSSKKVRGSSIMCKRLFDSRSASCAAHSRRAVGPRFPPTTTAGAGIERLAFGIARTILSQPGNILTRAETGIEQAHVAQTILRRTVIGEMLALAQHRFIRDEAEPCEILEHRLGERRRAAQAVDVLDAEEETSARSRAICSLSSAE